MKNYGVTPTSLKALCQIRIQGKGFTLWIQWLPSLCGHNALNVIPRQC